MSKKKFINSLDVSRETLEYFCEYESLLNKWNKKTNLVSKYTLVDIWQRHFLDSGRIVNHINARGKLWVDIGTGAGFPGLVIALLLRDRKIDCDIVLVEKNSKKVFFLNEVIRRLNLRVRVINKSINCIEPLDADILSARAFSDLSHLVEIAHQQVKNKGVCLFLKGESYELELDKTLNYWFFDYDVLDSLSNPSGKIIRVKNIFKR